MKIEFRGLVLQNYGSFNGAHSLNLGDLAVGVHFVAGENLVDKELGSNDAGKSTLFNAIAWCLYGKTSNDLRSTDIKAWHPKDGKTIVGLVARFDGKRHQIKRTAPGAIEIDGREAGQQEIDKLISMSFDVFKQTVLFGQEEGLFFDLPNREKLGLLSDVLELDKWEIRSAKAGERTRELEAHVLAIEGDIYHHNEALARAREHIKQEMAVADRFENELAIKLKNLKAQRDESGKKVAGLEKAAGIAQRIANNAAMRLGDLQAEEQIARDHMTKINQARAVAAERAAGYEREATQLRKELSTLGNSDTCPTCLQPLKGTDLGKHVKELRLRIKGLETKAKEARPGPDNNMAKWNDQLIQSRTRQSTVHAELEEAKHKLRQAETALIEVKTAREAARQQILSLEKSRNPHLATLKRLKQEAKQFKSQIAEFKETKAKAERMANRARYWIKGFKDVRLFVIEEVLEELELVTNAILEDMGLLGWRVQYAVERETKTGSIQTGLIVTILSPRNQKPVKWAVWGGGAKQRLRLAGALALSEVLLSRAGVEVDLEILDEPTKHMTEGGVEAVCSMLSERAKQLGRRVLYVDHMAREGALFESTITVRKTKQGSSIVTD